MDCRFVVAGIVTVILGQMPCVGAEDLTWDFAADLQRHDEPQNPLPSKRGDGSWHFLRTSRSQGPVASRTWIHDGRYVPLGEFNSTLFGTSISGWIHQRTPTDLAPFVARATAPITNGITWQPGEVMIAPGPDHAVILAWECQVSGRLEITGRIEHGQKCCGINSQINWFVEIGPAPDLESGFQPVRLASGHSDFGTESQIGVLDISGRSINPGDFVYFIVDAHADGTGAPHHGDATRVEVRVTVRDATRPPPPRFETDVRPILAEACFDCHGRETQEALLDLRTVTSILQGGENGHGIVIGKPGRSLMLDMLERGQMPPDDYDRLTYNQIAIIRRWIDAGAPADEKIVKLPPRTMITEEDRRFRAFQTPRRKPLPRIRTTGRGRDPIDRLVLHRLERDDLGMAPDADRRTLIRRAYFALIGLPPSADELDRFLNQAHPDAWEQLLDRLLASPHYGERWGRHWLDAVGYVDNRLFDGDLGTIYPNEGIWRYRDYVVRALNADRPYDRFLTEQLAGDQLVDWQNAETFTPEILDRLAATGFFRSIEDHTSEAQYGIGKRYEVVFDTMKMMSSSVMGLTLECCRCHNHKFDPIPQRDYYRLMAIVEPALNPHQWKRPQERWLADVSPAERRRIDQHNNSVQQRINELEQQRKTVEESDKAKIEALQSEIAGLQQSRRTYGKIQALWDVGPAPRSRILRRGQADAPGVAVDPGFPEILSTTPTAAVRPEQAAGDSTGLRLSLAQWLTQPGHPLTARVIVNRVWHHHFGRGIVATLGNFGRSGSPPSHPDLLDRLAVDFVEQGWSLKRLHRRIMTSTVYRQTSSSDTASDDASLLSRMPLRRLESEVIRDAVLTVAGWLDDTQGGPPVMITKPADGLSREETSPTPTSHRRRSLYLFARRVYPLKFLEVFDSPIVPVNCTQRMASSTVLQSFTQLNDEFMIDAAASVADRVRNAAGSGRREQIESAFRIVLSRKPDNPEVERCVEFLENQQSDYAEHTGEQPAGPLVDLCHMLLCTNEFLYVE